MPPTVRALLLTDVVESTKLSQALGDARMAEVWAAHDRVARDLLVPHHGREIDKSDGFLLLFENACDAAVYALAYHRALAALDPPLQARAGLHVGEVILTENAAADIARGAKPLEVEGFAKPTAARIMGLATGGQTLLSEAARAALTPMPGGWEMRSHGHYRLKGVAEPMELFEVGAHGEAPFAPPADAVKAYRVIKSEAAWRPAREVPHSLPAERDEFVGRSQELQALATRLDEGERLVTVLGMAGTGKTRLVRRYGWTWLGDWPGGVFFCDLSEARSRDGIVYAVAAALDAPLGKEDAIEQLGRVIAGRGKCLIVLDNFEQINAHAATTLGPWMERAGEASFVVTSRMVLAIPGEHVMPLEPLAPDGSGVDLFVVRAKARKPGFELTESNRQVVQEIVTLLDGLPLAIELAAARAAVLTPKQLLERLKDRFQVLVGARGVQARQATLRSAIDWSWTLLAPWEQAALAQVSVFVGGFTLEAAEHVLDLSAWPEAPLAIDVVQSLVDKSLLRTWTAGAGKRLAIDEMYFGMYVSIQEYAAEKLRTEGALPAGASGAPAERAAAERHGRYFAQFGTAEALDALATHGGVARHQALVLEAENLVAACRRAVGRADAPVAVATFAVTWAVFGSTGLFRPATEMGRQVVAIDGLGPGDRARAAYILASALRYAGQIDETVRYYQMALVLYREMGNHRGEARALYGLGDGRQNQGRVEEALQCWQDALPISRKVGDRRNEAICLDGLANLYSDQGRMEEALRHYQEALVATRETGNRASECHELGNLGTWHMRQGRMDEALQHFQDALAIAREASNRRVEGHVLGDLGVLHLHQGRLVEASANLHDALAIALDTGNRRFETNIRRNLGDLLLHEGRPEEAFGHLEQALALAREASYRGGEGDVLGRLGRLHSGLGRIGEARKALAAGEAILRSVDAVWDLALLLCYRGECERVAGDMLAAGRYLADATALADGLSVSPHSELGREIAKLRMALDGASPAPPA